MGGTKIATDRDSQALITGAWAMLQVTPAATVQWKAADGTWSTLTDVLRWADIPCLVHDGSNLQAELVMIDENLMRHDLTPAQYAYHTARRKEIYEGLYPETVHGSNQHTRSRNLFDSSNERFSAETAKSTGRNERTVQRFTPGSSLWYTRLLFNRYVVDTVQKMLDPDAPKSFRRAQQRAKKLYGRDFYWAPGDSAPARGRTSARWRAPGIEPARPHFQGLTRRKDFARSKRVIS